MLQGVALPGLVKKLRDWLFSCGLLAGMTAQEQHQGTTLTIMARILEMTRKELQEEPIPTVSPEELGAAWPQFLAAVEQSSASRIDIRISYPALIRCRALLGIAKSLQVTDEIIGVVASMPMSFP